MLTNTTSHAPVMGEHPNFKVPRTHLSHRQRRAVLRGPFSSPEAQIHSSNSTGGQPCLPTPNTNLQSLAVLATVIELVEQHGPDVQQVLRQWLFVDINKYLCADPTLHKIIPRCVSNKPKQGCLRS